MFDINSIIIVSDGTAKMVYANAVLRSSFCNRHYGGCVNVLIYLFLIDIITITELSNFHNLKLLL
jgi:hypothetical protein